VVRFGGDKAKADAVYKGVEPLTPDDIAEVVVFTASRRENVVIADTLIFPNHQVCGMQMSFCSVSAVIPKTGNALLCKCAFWLAMEPIF